MWVLFVLLFLVSLDVRLDCSFVFLLFSNLSLLQLLLLYPIDFDLCGSIFICLLVFFNLLFDCFQWVIGCLVAYCLYSMCFCFFCFCFCFQFCSYTWLLVSYHMVRRDAWYDLSLLKFIETYFIALHVTYPGEYSICT